MHTEARTESSEEVTAHRPLPIALSAQLKLWPEPRTDVGDLQPGWVTTAALFADDAALDDHLEYQGSFDEGVDRKSRAAFLTSDYCAMFSMTAVPLLILVARGRGTPHSRKSGIASFKTGANSRRRSCHHCIGNFCFR